MNKRVSDVLADYELKLQSEIPRIASFTVEEYEAQRDGMILGIGPETGLFLNILIKAARPKTIVEVGTSYGYSTVWLAEAAAAVGAHLVTFELSEAKIDHARERIKAAGLASTVEFVAGDALANLEAFTGTVDFALIDLWKELYISSFDRIYPRLSEGALVAADNVCLPPMSAAWLKPYVGHVRAQAGIASVTVPVGSGIELSQYSRNE
jgi:predicted O-methyltransferase YrrM